MSNDPFYSSEATLPNNFAEKVLEAEMMLDEGQVDLQTIQNLNELYKTAIEYYTATDARKATHFQKKLIALLTNPTTLQLISPQAKIDTMKAATLTANVKGQMQHVNTETLVKNMIEASQKKMIKSQSLIRLSLTRQEDKLKERMIKRTASKRQI